MIDITDLRAKLAAERAADASIDSIDAGWAWFEAHQDVVAAAVNALPDLLDELERAREALSDMAEHGLRFDLNPTIAMGPDDSVYAQMSAYMRRMDQSVRERARAALDAACQAGGALARPPRQVRECTICGEVVPMSHATDQWEARHATIEAHPAGEADR